MTLIEVMVALSIVAVLGALAAPSLRQLIESNRIASEVNSFTADLQLARSEAIKQGRNAVLCISANGIDCVTSGGNWERGWIIYLDENGDGTKDSDDPMLRKRPAWTAGDTLTYQLTPASVPPTGTPTANTHSISFSRDGFSQLAGATGKLDFASASGQIDAKRCVTITPVGRVFLNRGACT